MKDSGVTLLELLVTVTILSVLASVAVPLHRVTVKRGKELELRQQLRVMRAAIDLFKTEWNRDGDTLLGVQCIKNKLSCRDASGPFGYPKSLRALLGVELTSQEATVKGVAVRRYLRAIPIDPLTGKSEWRFRCYQDPPTADSWCGTDIYDVSTKSEEVALDGTKYRDW